MKACNSFYKGLYFLAVTIWGFLILRNEKYCTPLLFGNGDLKYLNYELQTYERPRGFRLYYLGTMGYHVHSLITHALHTARNDFVEMFLHHIVTIFLYG